MTGTTLVRWLGLAIAVLLASLAVTAPASAQASARVKCESWQFQPARCAVPGIVDAQLASIIAGDCRPGNWGSDRNGVWVSNGCRAVFDVATRGGWNGSTGGGWGGTGGGGWGSQPVRCESWDYRPARCRMDSRGGVRIQRVIAGDCRAGNWGSDRDGVWVANGCRAEFVAGAGGGYPGGGYPGGGAPGVRTIDCNSINYRPARCSTGGTGQVQIDRVYGGECILGRTWGFDRSSVWVSDGCRGRFRLY